MDNKRKILVLSVLKIAAAVIVASSLLFLIIDTKYFNRRPIVNINNLNVYLPFVFSATVDPRDIVTVGDQVICEHLFAFHAKENLRQGFAPVISSVEIDYQGRTIQIIPRLNLATSDDAVVSIEGLCDSFKESLSTSHHLDLSPLVKKIECLPDKIKIDFTQMPRNIKYLFTLADFSIFLPEQLPISMNQKLAKPTTGPYSYRDFSANQIHLSINENYPSSLRANKVEEVYLNSYAPENYQQFIRSLDVHRHHLAYFFGYSITDEELEIIRGKGYHIRQMPSEWLIYLGMNPSVPFQLRDYIFHELMEEKEQLLQSAPLGQEAFGISPFDRSFGVKKDLFFKLLAEGQGSPLPTIKKKLILATLDEWVTIPIFANTLNFFRTSRWSEFVEIKYFPRKEINKLWSPEIDLSLTPLGIAQADPISSFFFLSELRDIISQQDILHASIQATQDEFDKALLELEERIIRQRRMFPIGHFPGVVIESPLLQRDEDLSWGWGIQAWTYKIR